MKKLINWNLKSRFESEVFMLCPSPWIIRNNLFVFFGRLTSDTGKAHIDCMKINHDLSTDLMAVSYQCLNEHENSKGNIPNSLYKIGNATYLICAEFGQVPGHKHQLLAHKHKVDLIDNEFSIGARENFEFIDYKSSHFHTVAGMTYFQGKYFYAKGDEWFQDGVKKTPITRIFQYDPNTEIESEVSIDKEDRDIAYARPNFISINEDTFFSVSVRDKFGGYGSRLFEIQKGMRIRKGQTFYDGHVSVDENVLAYEYLFLWNDSLWCICTHDYRGSCGFKLFRYGIK